MKSHVWRPLYVLIGVVAVILAVRMILVPKDFGVQEQGYMYGFHRKGNEADWKAFPPKYRSSKYCEGCHDDKLASIADSPHKIIQCENCHGPAVDHPDKVDKLPINRTREQCLRCHFYLPYPTSGRMNIMGIDPAQHNPGVECVTCHNPHHPNLEGVMK